MATRAVPTLTLENGTAKTVTILGRDGESFARIGPKFVEGNWCQPDLDGGRAVTRVRAHHRVRGLGSSPVAAAHRRSPVELARPPEPTPRHRAAPTTIAKGGTVVVRRWAIPLEVRSRRVDIRGITEFMPTASPVRGSSTRLPLAAAVLGVALAAFLLIRRPRSPHTAGVRRVSSAVRSRSI